jgi:hypothetical protein
MDAFSDLDSLVSSNRHCFEYRALSRHDAECKAERIMNYHPHTAHADAIVRPHCPRCGTQLMLTRIEPDAPGQEKRVFECPNCEHAENIVANVG